MARKRSTAGLVRGAGPYAVTDLASRPHRRNDAAPHQDGATLLVAGLWVAGLDRALLGWPDLDAALVGVAGEALVATLIPCPVLFDDVAGRVPLVLAGHAHGGQLRLPPLPPLYMPSGCW